MTAPINTNQHWNSISHGHLKEVNLPWFIKSSVATIVRRRNQEDVPPRHPAISSLQQNGGPQSSFLRRSFCWALCAKTTRSERQSSPLRCGRTESPHETLFGPGQRKGVDNIFLGARETSLAEMTELCMSASPIKLRRASRGKGSRPRNRTRPGARPHALTAIETALRQIETLSVQGLQTRNAQKENSEIRNSRFEFEQSAAVNYLVFKP